MNNTNEKLGLYVCSNFALEVATILKSEKIHDVVLKRFHNSCNENPFNRGLTSLLNANTENQFSKILIFASSCQSSASDKNIISSNRKIEIIHLEQCFELFLNKESIYHFIRQGYYLISNGWLRKYKYHIKKWNFSDQSAKVFFRESLKKILFLDTGLPGDNIPKLEALSDYMGLPYEIFPVGLSYCRNYINKEILRWRVELERNKMNEQLSKTTKENADYFFIFKQLQTLVDYTEESLIIKEVFRLLNILFAPQNICYRSFLKEDNDDIVWFNSVDDSLQKNKKFFFKIEIVYQNEIISEFEIYGIKFPEFLEQYKKIIPVLSKICGIAIVNARKYKIIADQKIQLQIYSNHLDESIHARDKFFSIIAHDLRNPIGSFLGLTEFMAEEIASLSLSEIKEFSIRLKNSATTLNSLLENLLQWSRLQQGVIQYNPEELDLITIVIESISIILEPANSKGISVSYYIPPGLKVFADSNILQTVIRNLVSNALKFTKKNGSIKIAAIPRDDKFIEISIKDTGIGMTKSLIDKLFKLDERTNRKGTDNEPSSGLGLILCRDFIEKHNGKIWIESEVEKGSTFYFTIPSIEIDIEKKK
jgi:signal transduction histidine kinase